MAATREVPRRAARKRGVMLVGQEVLSCRRNARAGLSRDQVFICLQETSDLVSIPNTLRSLLQSTLHEVPCSIPGVLAISLKACN
jgi:hypothetical protein